MCKPKAPVSGSNCIEKRNEMSEQKVENSPKDSKEEKKEANIHSANSWETADLGDSDRKQKFLRLMGASKKEHQGRFVIGDHDPVHGRSKKDVSKMSEDLEEQYEQSMEHRRLGGRRGHIGLGFHQEEEKKKEAEEERKEEPAEKNEETGEKEENNSDEVKLKDCEKRKHSNSGEETDKNSVSSAKKMKLNFVKASS